MLKNKLFHLLVMLVLVQQLPATEVADNGSWIGKEAVSDHVFDPKLAKALVKFLKEESATNVVDFGCGMGLYVKEIRNSGINARGYDGNPDTPELTQGLCKVLDLSLPFELDEKFDWVVSLEVGEHIPVEFETNFIENLVRHTEKGIVLSWALKDQGGLGHVNCRNNPYIKRKICSYGFLNDVQAEEELRKKAKLSWFKGTIMVFRKK